MTIVAARRYSSGMIAVADLPLDGDRCVPLPHGQFDWIGLASPDESELERVQSQYGLHPLAVEDALNPTQMAKVDSYGNQLFIVARTAAIDSDENISYGQTSLFLSRDFVVSVRFGSERAHVDLRRRLENGATQLSEGPDFVAHAVLDYIVDGYLPIIEYLEEAAVGIEESAIEAFPSQATIRRIFRLRRQLRKFERIIGPMDAMCERLVTVEYPAIDAGARVWFRDVLDHVRRTMTRIDALRDTLASVVETASLLEQHRQGDMTRQLAAWAAILAVPTAIAGIYGMNFDYMPELRWRYGYFGVMALIASICGGLWLQFRKIGWL